jgi:hypothetical protein
MAAGCHEHADFKPSRLDEALLATDMPLGTNRRHLSDLQNRASDATTALISIRLCCSVRRSCAKFRLPGKPSL